LRMQLPSSSFFVGKPIPMGPGTKYAQSDLVSRGKCPVVLPGTSETGSEEQRHFFRALELYHWRLAVPGISEGAVMAEKFFEWKLVQGHHKKRCRECKCDLNKECWYYQQCLAAVWDAHMLCEDCMVKEVYAAVGHDSKMVKAELLKFRAKYSEFAYGRSCSLFAVIKRGTSPVAFSSRKTEVAEPNPLHLWLKERAQQEQELGQHVKRPRIFDSLQEVMASGLDGEGRSLLAFSAGNQDKHSVSEHEKEPTRPSPTMPCSPHLPLPSLLTSRTRITTKKKPWMCPPSPAGVQC